MIGWLQWLRWIGTARSWRSTVKRVRSGVQETRTRVDAVQGARVQRDLERARAGDPDALYEMGERHYQGLGVPRDYGEAARWFRQAADRNHARAQCTLGMMFAVGRGVDRSFEESVRWLEAAVDNGSEQARDVLESVRRKHSNRSEPTG